MANNFYGAILLTGGGTGALDAIPIAGLADLDAAFVQIDGIAYLYSFDAAATDAESSPAFIRPDDFATAGVWVLQNINLNNLTLSGGSILSNTGIIVLGGTGGTNNENITLDFETLSNHVLLDSGTGVSTFRFNKHVKIADSFSLFFSNAGKSSIQWNTTGNDSLKITTQVGDALFSGYISIMELADISNANRSPLTISADPVLRIYSSDEAEANDYIESLHDQSNPIIRWVNGILKLIGVSTGVNIDTNAANTVPILNLENTAGNIDVFRTDADPEGSITGSIGDLAIDSTNGFFYLKKSGSATNTGWVVVGGTPSYKSYSLSNPGNAGTFYVGGHYVFDAADANLTIGGTVVKTFGTAGEAHGAHAFCVAAGAGGTDLILTVTGVSITDAGVKNDSDSEILVADADAAITNQYFETSKKWLGQVTYTLTGSSGSFDFNYGFVKYEDFGNSNFTLTDFDATGEARANETGLNIEVLHHEPTAFVYDASSFSPNQTALISLVDDYGTNNDVANGNGFAYKRTGLSTLINGSNNEGIIIRVTTAVNNSINDASFHLGVTIN